MFRKSRKQKAAAQASDMTSTVKDQIVDLKDKVGPAASHAREVVVPAAISAAATTRDWASPRVAAARDWAAPKAQKGLDAAAPKLEQAVDTVSPKIDAARDKLVDEVLPKLVDAINAATSQAAAARDEAASRGSDAVAVLKGDAVAKPKKRRGRRLLILGSLAAGVAAAFAVLKRRPQDDPWAVPSGGMTSSWAPSDPTASSASAAAAADGSAAEALDTAAASEATEGAETAPAVEPTEGAEATGEGASKPAARARKTAKSAESDRSPRDSSSAPSGRAPATADPPARLPVGGPDGGGVHVVGSVHVPKHHRAARSGAAGDADRDHGRLTAVRPQGGGPVLDLAGHPGRRRQGRRPGSPRSPPSCWPSCPSAVRRRRPSRRCAAWRTGTDTS